ncbi:uncharacterized protein LOC105255143 [Camponotus floridanus]|uniref:uncharacterized protein LOC105255143 n=1 Tax=Camponotus floridanus TaxID=104421 RepID=UPI000DC672E5|nr:uncharacterized protein LOC105255143 [Camponotus floridanus]
MKSVWNYYYSITKRMLLLAGQWPYQRKKERLLRMSLMTLTSLSMIVPQIGKFIQCDKDVQCILTVIPTHLFQLVVIVKLYTCQFNNSKIKDLTDKVYSDWKSVEIPEECEIMKTYAAKARLFTLIYTSYYFIAAPIFVLITLTPQILDIVLPLNESRPILMPYEAHYFVRDDTEYFFYIFVHTLVGIIILCIAILAHDCMILTCIEHVCGIFAVAGFRFENLAYNENIDIMNNNLDNIYNQKIALSVHAHWRALQFAELLEDTFSITFIIQILINTAVMSVTLLKRDCEKLKRIYRVLEIAVQLDDAMEAVRYIAFVIGQLIHLFCFSLQGQRLIDHSLQMRDKIYNGSWYKIPVKSQKMLLHVMRQCLQPNFLSAGKIYIFSLKSFTTVLQSSMSYFTVLTSFSISRCLLKTMDATWNYYYSFVYKISSLLGLWPFMKPRTRIFRVTIFTIALFNISIPQIAYQFTCKKDLHCIFEGSTSYLCTIVIVLKMYTFQLNINTIKDLTRNLFVDWKKIRNPEEYEIMKSYARNTRRFSIVYTVYCSMAVFTFMSMSLIPFVLDIVSPLNQSRPVLPPYPGYYFVDIRENFLQIFLHSLIVWQILMSGIMAHDSMYVMFVEHICGMFSVIGFRFERLSYNHDELTEIVDPNDIYRKKVAFIVRMHRECLKYSKLLEDTFNMPFAAQMLIATIVMSVTLLQISRQDGELLDLIRYMLYVIGQLIHLFILNFEGQKLIDHSVQTRDRIYNSAWYKASIKSQKLLMLVMIKCLRPSVLSAGKIYIFSLENFTAVLQTSMSYFTVLASF